jgi:transcriptional regulator GlxA family with amidase domain
MGGSDRPLEVAILAVPEVTASTLYGMFDLFSAAGRDFAFITSGVPGSQRMVPTIVAREQAEFPAANGVRIQPGLALDRCTGPDVICIPDFFIDPGDSIAGRYGPEVAWLRRMHEGGAILASACSGAVLLAEAGLLAGCEATIHWGYVASIRNHYPGVRVRPERSLVVAGEANRIIMAGGGTSWQDLALYLIARFVGLRAAIEVARVYMLQWHELGQQPFAALVSARRTPDAVVDRCREWAARNYHNRAPVAAMVEVSGLPERSFMRRFVKATGLTPLAYVHALRLEEAKQMLETTDLAVAAIANEVGYEDAGFFGRLFRRRVGLTPAQYQRRFGALRRSLPAEG